MASITSGIAPVIDSPIWEDSNNTNVTRGAGNTASSSAIGASTYIIGGNEGATTITAADFGAIKAGSDIAQAGIASVEHGYDLLNALTGQALLLGSKSIKDQAEPLRVTLAKYASIIIGLLVLAWVVVSWRKKS